jgi:DNA-binding MarR family transcriptional regulator
VRGDLGLDEVSVPAVFALGRVGSSGCDDAVEDAEILENLLRSRLDSLAARPAEGTVFLLDQPERYAPPCEVDGEREAGRALFPLLVGIERRGPIGVVDLADRMGRDYTTVSRQVAKLESLGLVKRHASEADRRVSEATVTPSGKAMTDAVDRARERIVGGMFATWDDQDVEDLVRLMRKLADAMIAPGDSS